MDKQVETFADSIDGIIGSQKYVDAKTGLEKGKGIRKVIPRSSHGTWGAFDGRPDPVDTLTGQGESRLEKLLPIRYERMGASPFAFYRGNALGMAIDLSHTPNMGVDVQACGDAHIANFGIFGSPEGRLIFDINDFDETFRAPWEWDVKRLAASIQICGEERGFKPNQCATAVQAAVSNYQKAMGQFSRMGAMRVWNAHLGVSEIGRLIKKVDPEYFEIVKQTVNKAHSKNSDRAVSKLTEVVDGQRRVISAPPLIVPLRDILESKMDMHVDKASFDTMNEVAERILASYMKSLRPDAQLLISRYHCVDIALKVVGVGSVGTRCLITVMQGANENDYLVLQIKEAQKSVLEKFVGKHPRIAGGKRVVEGQRAMQLVSDPLLGYASTVLIDGVKRDLYVRQLWNSKGTLDLELITPQALKNLSGLCGWTLARAHARTGDRFQIAGYLGESSAFAQAMVKFAQSYARQNQADYQAFKQALDEGRLGVAQK